MTMNVSISFCPTDLTDLEVGNEGSVLDPDALLDRLRSWLLTKYPEAKICLQVGYRQGNRWARAWDSTFMGTALRHEAEDLAKDLLDEFFAEHLADSDLYKNSPQDLTDES